MENCKDGGPAFPVTYPAVERGLSLRDWFAGKALQSLVVCNLASMLKACNNDINEAREVIVHSAYKLADAMLEEREKEGA